MLRIVAASSSSGSITIDSPRLSDSYVSQLLSYAACLVSKELVKTKLDEWSDKPWIPLVSAPRTLSICSQDPSHNKNEYFTRDSYVNQKSPISSCTTIFLFSHSSAPGSTNIWRDPFSPDSIEGSVHIYVRHDLVALNALLWRIPLMTSHIMEGCTRLWLQYYGMMNAAARQNGW